MGTNPLRDMKTLFDFVRVLRAEQPDVALFFTVKPVIYGSLAARLLGIPAICTITGLGTAFMNKPWITRTVLTLYKAALRWPKKVFFQNNEDMTVFTSRGLVDIDRAARVPGSGVDLARFAPLPVRSNGEPVFLFCGRLLRDKGVGEFVEAARLAKQQHPSARFELLGPLDAPNRSAIGRESVQAWEAEGVVTYLGEADDVVPFMAAADCVVLASYYPEGVPRSLLEAASMARPIITTDMPGCRSTVEDGVTGLLCEPRDVASLARQMNRMIEMGPEQRTRMGRKGREKMEREFDERIVVGQYLAAIDEMLHACEASGAVS